MLNYDKPQEWNSKEAESWFTRIEEAGGAGEWYDLELKQELSFEDTSKKTNTTQRVVSGFANTRGGTILVGFSNKGEPLGFEYMENVENHLHDKLSKKLKPRVPFFKAHQFKYKDKNILAVFVAPSLKPIQCDNGVYYYREQSGFSPIPHDELKSKFRQADNQEMYIEILNKLFDEIDAQCSFMNTSQLVFEPVPQHIQIINDIGRELYFFLVRIGAWEDYTRFKKQITSLSYNPLPGNSAIFLREEIKKIKNLIPKNTT